MNIFYLLLSLSIASFSYAWYDNRGHTNDLHLAVSATAFRIGRDVYSYGRRNGNVTKFWINENKELDHEYYYVKDLDFLCLFCFSFVISNNSVLTLVGYDDITAANASYNEKMGVFYFDPVKNTAPKGDDYKMLPGNPLQRIYHQAVMTPDKKSVYIFGGAEHAENKSIDLNIVQFDISSSTFINHQQLTFVGGAATMLPSGIVVLAFGAFDINVHNGKALYNTSSVFLYDTTKHKLYTQNITGTPPSGRGSITGTLGPDNECIYYYGGSNFDQLVPYWDPTSVNFLRVQTRDDLVILNTTSWTWIHPKTSGPESGPSYEHFSLLYENNSLIIGGGLKKILFVFDFSLLTNLPSKGDPSGLDHLQWYTHSELDSAGNGDNKNNLSTGAIVGIVIASAIPVIAIFYFLCKKFKEFRGMFWKKRLGEPVWTEILRTFTRFILLGVLLAYIIYSIIRAVNSASVYQEYDEVMENMPLPDVRVCSLAKENGNGIFYIDAFTPVCDFGDGRDCTRYFHSVTNYSHLPVLDSGSGSGASCQVLIPPLDLCLHTDLNANASDSKDKFELRIFKNYGGDGYNISKFYITYYSSQVSPYRTLLNMNGPDSKMSTKEAEDWLKEEQVSAILTNTVEYGVSTYGMTTYSLTQTQTLTNSTWNYFGWSDLYEMNYGITVYLGPQSSITASSSTTMPVTMIRVKPNEYSIHHTKEQKVSTILSGLASAGGVLSLIVVIQTLLFGFRPNSPWGIIHRWSWGRRSATLRNKLRDEFNPGDSPIPMVTRVSGNYVALPTSSDSTTLDMVPLNTDDDDQSIRLELGKIKDRMQLMEDLFKTYYIDDEMFQRLNEARRDNASNDGEKSKKVKGEAIFTSVYQNDEETPINQTD